MALVANKARVKSTVIMSNYTPRWSVDRATSKGYFGKNLWYTNTLTWELRHLLSRCYEPIICTTGGIWPNHLQITLLWMIITPMCFFWKSSLISLCFFACHLTGECRLAGTTTRCQLAVFQTCPDMRVVHSHDLAKVSLDFWCFIRHSGKYNDNDNNSCCCCCCYYQLDTSGVPRLPSPVASGRRVAVAVRAVGEDGEGSGSVGQMPGFVCSVLFLVWNINEHQETWMKINEECDWIWRNRHIDKEDEW